MKFAVTKQMNLHLHLFNDKEYIFKVQHLFMKYFIKFKVSKMYF